MRSEGAMMRGATVPADPHSVLSHYRTGPSHARPLAPSHRIGSVLPA